MITNGMGGIQPDGIRYALELEAIPQEQWKGVTLKAIAYITAGMKAQSGEKEESGKVISSNSKADQILLQKLYKDKNDAKKNPS